jgi:hypothetical protein
MKAIAAPIAKLLGRRYNEKKFAVEYKKVVDSAKSTELTKLTKRDKVFSLNIPKGDKEEEVSYMVSAADLKRAKTAIGKSSMGNAGVGKYTFDYFVKRECK